MPYVLGLDLGTSSLKGLLVEPSGKVVAEASADYSIEIPAPGFSEQDALSWLRAAEKVLADLLEVVPTMKDELEGISFSGQMHSLVLLDENYQPLRPAILWNDVRTTEQCERIMAEAGDRVLSLTKNVALEGFTLPKLLWVQENEPEIWAQARYVQLPKDFLRLHLTGEFHMDYSDAAGTLLFDVNQKAWSAELLDLFKIPAEIMPAVVESGAATGVLKPAIQAQFGFTREVAIFAGGADNACAALGAGILSEDKAMASIGTSGVFLSFEDSSEKDYAGQLHLFNHSLPGAYYSMGVTLAAGNSLNWFKETFAPTQSFNELLAPVGEVPAGSDGLLFAPYIVGERTPYRDAKIRGSFIGIDSRHRLPHFTRSVLEGIVFSLKDSQRLMEEVAHKEFRQVVSVGGGAKNKDWLQMQADIFDAEIVTLTTEQGPGLGAAMLAAVGCGWFADLPACAEVFVSYQAGIKPIPENVAAYAAQYQVYREMYPATKEICANVAR